ncbi:MAG: nucleotidyltransferase domain-containing protein [Candidatus Woesearchaeota archaeon]
MAKKDKKEAKDTIEYKGHEHNLSVHDHNKPHKSDLDSLQAQFPDIPDEAKKKLEHMKKKIDKFKDKLLEKFEEYVLGIALLPPSKDEDKKEKINLLVLVDDADSKKMTKDELRDKLTEIVTKIGKEADDSLNPETLLLSDLWQNCYDAKYEILQLIASSAIIYDKGMLAAIKLSEIHKTMVLKKFEKYIVSYVLAGSLVQGKATPESDIDVFLVIDDTDVKKMTRGELKEKLRAIIIGMGIDAGKMTGIENKINIQVYILTDFWESIKEANPVIFTFLRDGIPLYDRGIFMPWKQLLQMGRIKPSPESIEMFMHSGDQVLERVKYKLREIGTEDFFWAAVTTSQAAIMLYGLPPPTPKETPELLRQIFTKKEKILEEKYIKTVEKILKVRKDLEHGTKKEVSGTEIDELLSETEDFLKRSKTLFEDIEDLKRKEELIKIYDDVLLAVREVLKLEDLPEVKEEDLFDTLKHKMINSGKLHPSMLTELKDLEKEKEEFKNGKLTKAEINKAVQNARTLIRNLVEYVQRTRSRQMEQVKLRVKYGEKLGEVLLLSEQIFFVMDLAKDDKKFKRAIMNEEGVISHVKDSSIEELEKELMTPVKPRKLFITNNLLVSLELVFGDKVEIIIA